MHGVVTSRSTTGKITNVKKLLLSLVPLGAIALTACSSTPRDRSLAEVVSSEPTETDIEAAPLEAGMKRLVERGYERYRRSDFMGTIQQWEPIWLATGKAADNWTPSLLYYCYLSTGQNKKALTLAEQNLREKPHNPLSYQQVGLALLWLGKNAEAEDALRRAVEFESHSPEAFFYLGLSQQRQGKKTEAEKSFAQADSEYLAVLESNPSDFPANYGFAYSSLYRNVNVEEAFKRIGAARESLRVNPDVELTPDRSLYLGFYLPLLEGMYLNRIKQPKESLDKLIAALQYSPSGARPDLAEVYFFLASNLKALGQSKPSKEFLAKSLELDPNGPYAKLKLP